MEFDLNSPILFVMVGIIIAVVMGQSVYFLIKALRRANEIGMDKKKLHGIIRSAAIFTVAPAIAIVISVMTLSNDLGLPLPWLRLSVVGSMSYETIAATNAMNAMGIVFGQSAKLSAQEYVTVSAVMTLSIMVGIWLVPVLAKRLQNGVELLEKRNRQWGEIFQSSLFIGMVSAFVGYVFSDFSTVFHGSFEGLIPVCVMIVSALLTCGAGILLKRTNLRWLSDYALPISLIGGMAAAIPITAWLS